MSLRFWDLFWTTGMPEAWLMSRNQEEARQARAEARRGEGQSLHGPFTGFQSRMSESSPGGPEGLY